jgi:hypothetical protein
MYTMLDIIEPKIDFPALCEKYYCEFSCAIFIRYDNGARASRVHLDERYKSVNEGVEYSI